MCGAGDDYLGALLRDGPAGARCKWVRALPSDDFGPRALARRRDDGRPVTVRGIAIADLAWQLATPQLQALASVESDFIAPLLGYGRHEGLGYFIHAHSGGPRLSTRLRECGGRLPYEAAIGVMAQVIAAVSTAHHAGVVVGGVRPQDVRVVESSEPGLKIRLRNFGLAALLGVPAGRSGATDHPSIYRAPEADVSRDAASDVFSLGVLFIRLLTGPLPQTASGPERAEVMRERLHQAMRDVALTDGLAILIAESVDLDLTLRPDNATEMLQRLRMVVPATVLRLPLEVERGREADDAEHWPARQWTMRAPAVSVAAAVQHVAPTMRSQESSGAIVVDPTSQDDRAVQVVARQDTSQSIVIDRALAAVVSPVPLASQHERPTGKHRPSGRHMARSGGRQLLNGPIGRLALGVGLLCGGTAVAVAATVTGVRSTPPPVAAKAADAPSRPPTAVVPGTLVVESSSRGTLIVDGQQQGPTTEALQLSPGIHVVRVVAEGHEPWRSRVQIAAGQEHRLVATLVPRTVAPEPDRG